MYATNKDEKTHKTKDKDETKSRNENQTLPFNPLNKLYQQLRTVQSQSIGYTHASGCAKSLPPLPGLFVDGVGDIPLPLTEIYFQKLTQEGQV